MFHTESFESDKIMDTSKEDYDICNAEPSKKRMVKFIPSSETKLCSMDQFTSSRWLSKSVPRRNRTVVRYKINRSLNFDIGHRKNDYFMSPKTSVDNSPRNNLHLSRSAKILKALNIDYSPMKSSGYKKINKTLNFELTPSPKKFSSANKSHPQMSSLHLSTSSSSSRINKTLNFDSSEDSPIANSTHDTSVESIDENQNQTPSQRNSKVKKSLSYTSLSSNASNTSLDFNLLSPSLRTDLREKIDDIVQASMSSNLQSMKKSPEHEILNADTMIVSTPRNLYNDLSDEDDDRPETPKNAVRLIPESMSAIKKSHKKERVSGRFAHRVQVHTAKSIKMEMAEDENERPSTPSTSDTEQPASYNLRSIKKSHKKDKSRRKSCGYRSEDELSETGSLFDYSAIEDEITNHKESVLNPDEKNENFVDVRNTIETNVDATTMQSQLNGSPDVKHTTATGGPTTPENRIDYLQRIMTDSIKRSHKKIKETNKKSLIKGRILEKQVNDTENIEVSPSDNNKNSNDHSNYDNNCVTSPIKEQVSTPCNKNRSSTPENMNSSRLLLAQFSSVKKSHKKDKHRKMGFAQRHIIMTREKEYDSLSPVAPEDEQCNKASSLTSNIPLISLTEPTLSNNTLNCTFSSLSSDDKSEYYSLGTSLLESIDSIDIKSSTSSPNKRKSDENGNAETSSSLSNGSNMEFESAEDEFKIFTPIKKRKPLIILPSQYLFNNNNNNPSEINSESSLSNRRCDTPKISFDISTPERKNNFIVSAEDNKKCSSQAAINDTPNENGRLTPVNNDRLERISALSSIKKSHKKDKWANARRRGIHTFKESSEHILECNNRGEVNDCSANLNTSIDNWRPSRVHELSSDSGEKTESHDEEFVPKPSTSNTNAIIELISPMKTPPNGLQAKTYLRLIQATSIKRSHKKMRERKKVESIILDPNLSDDGSIFDESEKSFNDSATRESNSTEINDNQNDFMPLDDSYVNKKSSKKMSYSRSSHSFGANRSNDGSIFGSDDEMDNCPNKS
ncbi:hypothetical protein PV328_002109 [Microctonus aethiopoides]|uniref:Uncharacterized protein n=1 Tax=Microctonus aethiopoides TaxID=144406 RepID=A0AA39FYD5_9HYME|nr:hypothetical protein PV328_002109 [Microctonus aethiopoides]